MPLAWVLQDIPEQVQEKPLGCGGSLLLLVLGIIAFFFYGVTEIKKQEASDSPKTQTEQVSTQTTKTQSTYTASDNSYSTTSKSTINGSNSTSSESVTISSNNASTISANISSEYDESYQTYLALSTVLENEGKSLKLCEAQNETNGQEANVIGKMSQLRGTKYYNNALKDLVRCCPKYAKEYSKNGKYFASEAEFYQSYINPDYSKILKAKKKGN